MINPFLKTEWLREGRNIRLPLLIIFYIAIMAFIMILFMVFNEESFQQGYYYNTTTYQYQFLILSTFQIAAVLLLTPFTVSRLYVVDKEKNMLEQFEMIPGISVQYVIAKMTLVLAVHALLFFSRTSGLGAVMHLYGYQRDQTVSPGCDDPALCFLERRHVHFFLHGVPEECRSFCGDALYTADVHSRHAGAGGDFQEWFPDDERQRPDRAGGGGALPSLPAAEPAVCIYGFLWKRDRRYQHFRYLLQPSGY